jgi:hypothetical protein
MEARGYALILDTILTFFWREMGEPCKTFDVRVPGEN